MCMADIHSRAGGEYAVAHCNFHLRGADSDADAEFVEDWARKHGMPFFRADFDTSAYASEHGISIEMAARELRYDWFARIASENGFDAVAVAHNANDNAETLILNLLRGTGLRGITGMSSDSFLPGGKTKLIRPLLSMTRAEIEAYAEANGVEYREDRTNAENDAHRNRIRNEVFPEFAKVNPSFVRTLNADMKHFAQADAIVDDYFREALANILSEDGTVDVDKLLGLKHWEYVFFRITEPCGFSARTLDAALALLAERSGGRGTFAGKRFFSPTHVLETSAKGITIRERTDSASGESMTVEGPGTYVLNGRSILIESLALTPDMKLKQPSGTLICDAGALPFPFILRGWRAGDWMCPFGMEGRAKKLSDLFADNKFSLSDKDAAVVIESPELERDGEGHVAAVAGLRMDEALRVAKGSEKILRITIL